MSKGSTKKIPSPKTPKTPKTPKKPAKGGKEGGGKKC